MMLVMYEILKNGGIVLGGINFDLKVWCFFFEMEDLLFVYIVGMDIFVWGLKVVVWLIEEEFFEIIKEKCYVSYKLGVGEWIVMD